MTPGTHPRRVSRKTIITEPQPRSSTANGGKMTANSTCKQDIVEIVLRYFCLRDLMSAMTEITIPVTAKTNEITEMQFINVLYDLVMYDVQII